MTWPKISSNCQCFWPWKNHQMKSKANSQYGYILYCRKKARLHHHQTSTNTGGILPAMMIDSQSHFPRLLMLFLGAGNELEDAKSEQKKTHPNHNQYSKPPRTTWSSWIKAKRQKSTSERQKGFICKHFSSWRVWQQGWINLFFCRSFVCRCSLLLAFFNLHSHFFSSSWTCKCHTMCISLKSLNNFLL